MRRFDRWLIGSLALVLCMIMTALFAATPPALTWIAPTLDSDGITPVAVPLTYNVYEGPKGPGKTLVGSSVTRTTYTAVHAGMCYQVSAVDKGGIEGLLSAEICDTVPNPPTALTIK
jgi:hypothetical protein